MQSTLVGPPRSGPGVGDRAALAAAANRSSVLARQHRARAKAHIGAPSSTRASRARAAAVLMRPPTGPMAGMPVAQLLTAARYINAGRARALIRAAGVAHDATLAELTHLQRARLAADLLADGRHS